MKQVLHKEIAKERCNAKALGAFNSSVSTISSGERYSEGSSSKSSLEAKLKEKIAIVEKFKNTKTKSGKEILAKAQQSIKDTNFELSVIKIASKRK